MSVLEFLWIVIHPWFWIGGAALFLGSLLYIRNHRKPAYLVIASSLFPLWLSMQRGIEHVLQATPTLSSAEVHLLKAFPYIWVVVVTIGFLFWLIKGVTNAPVPEDK